MFGAKTLLSIIGFFVMAVTNDLAAQESPASDEAADRLKFMKESVQVYKFTTGSNDREELKLQMELLHQKHLRLRLFMH